MRFKSLVIAALVVIPAAIIYANVVNHRVPLKHVAGEVLVVERQDGTGLWMYHAKYGSFEAKTDGEGNPTEHSVAFGKMKYWDLNGDGTIDARFESGSNDAAIWIDESWLKVRDTKDGFSSREKRGEDFQRVYVFQDGRWAAR